MAEFSGYARNYVIVHMLCALPAQCARPRPVPDRGELPNAVRALTIQTHEGWQESSRYLDMDLLKEEEKAAMGDMEAA